MERYSNETTATNNSRNIDKWIALRLMQHVEQVYNIAEMLSVTMEDLSGQMTDMESELENLSEATETLQEKIDEIAEMIQETVNQIPNATEIGAHLAPENFPI